MRLTTHNITFEPKDSRIVAAALYSGLSVHEFLEAAILDRLDKVEASMQEEGIVAWELLHCYPGSRTR